MNFLVLFCKKNILLFLKYRPLPSRSGTTPSDRPPRRYEAFRSPRAGCAAPSFPPARIEVRYSSRVAMARVMACSGNGGSADRILGFVRQTLDSKVSVLATDKANCYHKLDIEFLRRSVDHGMANTLRARSTRIRLKAIGRC